MRRLGIACGVVAIAGTACASLLGGNAPVAVPSFSIKPRPGPIFRLPLPPGGPVPPNYDFAPGQVMFVSTRDGAAEIYQMDDSGAGQTRLTSRFGTVADPTLSTSGLLTYSAFVDGNWEILAGGANSSEQITHDRSRDRHPRWIDPTTLVYVSNRSGNDDIWRLQRFPDRRVDLTSASPGPDLDPAPSPDGKRLAYASAPTASSPEFDIYVLTLATMEVQQLTEDGAGNRRPSWSPDGTRIAFDRAGSGGSDIWVMNADGSAAHPVVATSADEFGASYTPSPIDKKARFAYVTNDNGNYEIWAANDNGSNAIDLSQSPGGDDLAPFWAPAPTAVNGVPQLGLTPTEVEGAGGGPNTTVECTVAYKGKQPIVGTPYADVICGSNHADVIRGKGGNDVIYPRGGRDKVFAGKGDDYIYGRGGKTDFIRGNAGHDVAYVDDGDDPQDDVEISIP